jgi:hypothetical protein
MRELQSIDHELLVTICYRHRRLQPPRIARPPDRHLRPGESTVRWVIAGARICYTVGSPAWRIAMFPTTAEPAPRSLWLPIWLPGDRIEAGIRTLTCAPTATRTRDLLLRRHFRSVAGRCRVWPDVPLGCTHSGWMWPGVALHLRSLALVRLPATSLATLMFECSGPVTATESRAPRASPAEPGRLCTGYGPHAALSPPPTSPDSMR